jgi:hypothetical protein
MNSACLANVTAADMAHILPCPALSVLLLLLLVLLQNFFGMAPRRTPTPAGPSGDTSQGAGSQHEGSGQQQQQQQQGSGKELGRMWAPPGEALSEQQVRQDVTRGILRCDCVAHSM